MKRSIFLALTSVLIVIVGFFAIFYFQSQKTPADHKYTETKSSSKSASREANIKNDASNSDSTATKDSQKRSSGQSEEQSSSVPVQSSDSAENHTSSGDADAVTSSSAATDTQAVSHPKGAWVKTFEEDLYKDYHATPTRYKYIGNGNWEVWVKEYDTGQNPYVTVNQYTGKFHG